MEPESAPVIDCLVFQARPSPFSQPTPPFHSPAQPLSPLKPSALPSSPPPTLALQSPCPSNRRIDAFPTAFDLDLSLSSASLRRGGPSSQSPSAPYRDLKTLKGARSRCSWLADAGVGCFHCRPFALRHRRVVSRDVGSKGSPSRSQSFGRVVRSCSPEVGDFPLPQPPLGRPAWRDSPLQSLARSLGS